MATFSKVKFSASTQGKPITATGTAPGTIIHTTGTSSSIIDEVWLYATNYTATDVFLTVYFGGMTTANERIEMTVTAESGLYLVVPGLILTGDGSSGASIIALAGTGSAINIAGYVNRITP